MTGGTERKGTTDMSQDRQHGVGGGIRAGVGILSAFIDAMEETIREARERGDLGSDRARALVAEAAQRMQESVEAARERLDWVPRHEFDALREELDSLRRRVAALERAGGGVPEEGGKPYLVD